MRMKGCMDLVRSRRRAGHLDVKHLSYNIYGIQSNLTTKTRYPCDIS
jgi:hypothetical protein